MVSPSPSCCLTLSGLENENRKLRVQSEADQKTIDALKVQGEKDAEEIARLKKLLEEQQAGRKTVSSGLGESRCLSVCLSDSLSPSPPTSYKYHSDIFY